MLSLLEIVFGITSSISIICSCITVWILRKDIDKGSAKVVSAKSIQRWGFSILVPFHIASFAAYYMDLILFDGKETYWNRNKVYAWPQLCVYMGIDSLLIIQFSWILLFWGKISSNISLVWINNILKKAADAVLVFQAMKMVIYFVIICEIVILVITFEDLGRTFLLSSLLLAIIFLPIIILSLIVMGNALF